MTTLPSNIELKNVKHAAFASEETDCFEATIYIDGKRAGTVRNDGHGGSNMYYTEKGRAQDVEAQLEAVAKTLPPMVCEFFPEGLAHDADTLVGAYFDRWQLTSQLAKLLKKKIVFVRDNDIYSSPVKPEQLAKVVTDPAYRERARTTLKAAYILNGIPFDNALALFEQHGTTR